MKFLKAIKENHFSVLLITVLTSVVTVRAQNIAVNTTGAAAAATNMFEVTQTSTTANTVGIYSAHSGAISGTGYALYATKTGASTTNIGGYFSASGATSNYGLIVPSGGGNVGIGISAPTGLFHITQAATANGALTGIVYTGAVNTNQTLSTEIPSLTLTTAGRQWATGALATQREVLITQPAYSFVGASTITNAATLGIAGAPISNTNTSLTNTHALLIQATSTTDGTGNAPTNSYGITANAQTGATNNYAAAFLGGNVGIGTSSPASTLDVQGSMGLQVTSISGATTLNQTHNVVLASDAGGSFTITLPAAASNTDKTYYIKKTNSSANTITIDGNGAETIDGATTLLLYVQYDAVRIICDGSNWYVIGNEIKPHTCRLRRANALALVNATYTDAAFDTEDFDIGSIGDPTTNNRIDIRRAGKYLVSAHWRMTAVLDDGQAAALSITVNGTGEVSQIGFSATANYSVGNAVATIFDLAAGDYITMQLWQGNAATSNTSTSLSSQPTIQVTEIR